MRNIQDIESGLAAIVDKLMPGGQGIDNLVRLSGGASQETWAFDAIYDDDARRSLILRRKPGGAPTSTDSHAIDLPMEAALIDAASAAGVPVPHVVHVCDPDGPIGEAFIMDRLLGETLAPRILRKSEFEAARDKLSSQCGRALAGLHAVDTAELPELPRSDGLAQVEQYETIYTDFDIARPTFDLAIQWLRKNAPAPVGPVLVHGDFRIGNLMVDESGLVGILDWELAHLGDPREDIAWLCVNSWRFGNAHNRAGGFGQLEDLLAAYAEGGGQAFTPTDIDWWEMLGTLKWGVMCMIMYEAFRSGSDPSVERAAIGRRVSETEIDLINLFERI